MTRPVMRRAATLLILMAPLLMLPPLGAAQQVTYHRVAPKIYVPFDPNTVKVLHQSARLFTVEVPHRGYASSPKVAPFGDAIVFVPGESTFAFTSVFLEPVRLLRIPQDVASAPPRKSPAINMRPSSGGSTLPAAMPEPSPRFW